LNNLRSKKPEDLWEEDLVRVQKKYKEWLPQADESRDVHETGGKKSKKSKRKN
jgi:hypothetical protein